MTPPVRTGSRSDSLRSLFRSVLLLNAGPWRWSVGVEAALAIGLPAGTLTLAGHAAQGLIASLGGFTVLYFTAVPRSRRAVLLPFVGTGLVLAAALGELAAPSLPLTLAALIATTTLAALLAGWSDSGPPGAVMFVVVAGVSGYLASRVADPGSIPLLVALGAACAYAVVAAPLVLTRRREPAGVDVPARWAPRRQFDAVTSRIAARIVIAASIAALLGAALGIHRIYWVMVSTVAVLQTGPVQRRVVMRAAHRALGSVLGIGLFAALAWTRPAGIALVILLAALQSVAEVVIARHYGLALLFITPIPLLISATNPTMSLADVAADRLLDTLLGCLVAVTVYWAHERWRPPALPPDPSIPQ